ncbi:MAG: prolyl aminopeptidase [Pseudomonadota bacterium]
MTSAPAAPRTLYPPIEPNAGERVAVGDGHELYTEECGNPDGKPVVVLHGGPGGGGDAGLRRFHDPARYRIIVFDQRGAGRSRPFASLNDNTTQKLIEDIEALRRHYGVDRWQVFGGSWGSTLALAYSQAHPERVTELVLRGIFLLRRRELAWFYERGGASELFPDLWEDYVAPVPEAERGDMQAAYYRRLTSDDADERLAAARAWSVWEGSTSCLQPNAALAEQFGAPERALAMARIECHYFVNGGFIRDGQLLDDIDRIRHIPGVIVQGRYDVVCPIRSAWDLHRAWPEAKFAIVATAGHSAYEPGNTHELVSATDAFA